MASPREDPIERHPIQVNLHHLPLERRVQLLEMFLARLWDQVWWMNLPTEKRAEYESQGFSAPISKFYEELEE